MTHEVAMVFDKDGRAIYWLGGSGASVADSRSLWSVLWENRERLGGVAHTHPWDGPTGPSGTDLTTNTALEQGLGLKLVWPVVSMTHVRYIETNWREKQDAYAYRDAAVPVFADTEEWQANIRKLREMSQDKGT